MLQLKLSENVHFCQNWRAAAFACLCTVDFEDLSGLSVQLNVKDRKPGIHEAQIY